MPYLKLRLKDSSAAIELASIDVTGFRHIINWLYNGNLPTLVSGDGLFDEDVFDTIYKVADFLMIAELKSTLRAYVCPLSRRARNSVDQPGSRS